MLQKAPAMTVRHNLGELLNGVQYRHDMVLITKAGKPVAAIVDIDMFERIRRMKSQFENLSKDLAKAYKGIDSKVAQKEIDMALKEARDK